MRAAVVSALAALLTCVALAAAAAGPAALKVEAAFAGGRPIDVRHACDGADVSPALRWTGAPRATRTFAVVVVDPDAPAGPFFHWLIWNIPAASAGLAEGAVPSGTTQGTNDFGRLGWAGPCPPRGQTHHYRFQVLALDTRLSLASGARAAEVLRALRGHVVAQGEVVGTFRH